jgi:Putative quorum-sensing-regulated virulence factor
MKQAISIRDQVCLKFGDTSSLIEIRIAEGCPATVSILSQRSHSGALLDGRERKLLRLALDKAVQPGELRNAAEALIRSWRERGVTVEDFDHESQTLTIEIDHGRKLLPFGKYEGHRVSDVPYSYLKWLVGQMRQDARQRREYADLIFAMDWVLSRGVVR